MDPFAESEYQNSFIWYQNVLKVSVDLFLDLEFFQDLQGISITERKLQKQKCGRLENMWISISQLLNGTVYYLQRMDGTTRDDNGRAKHSKIEYSNS